MFTRLKIVTFILTYLMIIISSGMAFSDEAASEKDLKVYIMAGGSSADIDPLNERLLSKGYPEFDDTFGSFGAGALMRVSERVLVGVEGQVFVGGKESFRIGTDHYASRIIGGCGFLNTGYLVHTSERCDIYPLVGIGFGGMSMKIGKTSFDQILENPQNTTYISSFSFMLNAALGAEYKFRIAGDDMDKKFLIVGVRGGYAFSPFDGDWYQDEFTLSGAPDGGVSGPYLCLTFGVSGIITPDHVRNKVLY